MYSPFSRIVLFLVLAAGFGVLFFGGLIAWRGVTLYSFDAVLMGTGGGLMLGGLLVIALTVGAMAQVSTARDTAAMRRVIERGATARPAARAAEISGDAAMPAVSRPKAARREPVLRSGREG